jgi:hypothetical protein
MRNGRDQQKQATGWWALPPPAFLWAGLNWAGQLEWNVGKCAVIVNKRQFEQEQSVTVAKRSNAWTVFARSDASRSQQPRGLRHELSSLARTLAGHGSRAV